MTFAPPRQSTQNSILQKPSPVTIATVHPVQNASYHDTDHTENITTKTGSSNFMQQFNSWKQNKQNPTATVRPLPNSPSHQKKSRSALKNQRSNPRRQTISSSQPAWFENPARKEGAVTSVAGDLISGVSCWILWWYSIVISLPTINTWASGDSPLAQLVKELDLSLFLCVIRRPWNRRPAEPINNFSLSKKSMY